MEKTKGIVLRTSPKVTVIYTSKSDFLEIPTPKDTPTVGQTIEVNLKHRRRLFMSNNPAFKYVAAAAVMLLILSISAFSLLFVPNMAVASIALDINNNKSIELSLNKNGKVIKEPDVNDGSDILEGLSTKGLDIFQTVDLIVENANHKGRLNETQNLIMASVVPMNNREAQMIDTDKIRNTIRDAMTRGNLSGSVVVSQANQKIQQEAKQQGMTMNGYLIYTRSENKGITVQPDTLRNDVQKALVDAHVSIASLFPDESFEVKVQNMKDNSTDTKKQSNGPQVKPSLNMGSAENHGYMNPSAKQNPSSSSTPSNGMNPSATSPPPLKQPMQQTSPNLTQPISSPVSPGSMPTPQQPMSTPYSEIMGH